MRPTRRTQPYRKGVGARAPSPAMAAMRRGKAANGQHPQDMHRLATKRAAQKRRRIGK